MKALVLDSAESGLIYQEWEDPKPDDGEVLVDLKAAALNHRDVYITQGLYPGIVYPVILGSDGSGHCNGKEVVINPSMDWGQNPEVQAKEYQILGMPKNGTMGQKVAVHKDQVFDKPAHLDWAEAAALPLAGLTAYRALFTRGKLKSGERVLINGVGGGVALFAFQFALAKGAQVFVTSGSADKLKQARKMGAAAGANYKEIDWDKYLRKQSGGFHLIIDSAGGEGFSKLMKLAMPGGRIVTYGGTLGKVPDFSPQLLFWKQLTLMGSTMGNDEEFAAMLDLVNEHQIRPVVDSKFDLKDGAKAFDRMDKGLQFGKIVLHIP